MTEILFLDTTSGELLGRLRLSDSEQKVHKLQFSPDGKQLMLLTMMDHYDPDVLRVIDLIDFLLPTGN